MRSDTLTVIRFVLRRPAALDCFAALARTGWAGGDVQSLSPPIQV